MQNKKLNIEKPLLFTVVTCTLVYLYLSFENKKINKKNKKKKSIDFIPIVMTGLVTFFISYNYMCNNDKNNNIENNSPIQDLDTNNLIGGNNNSVSESFMFLGKNSINHSKPDVFLDIADF
jgi:multisubunit Na+/H+ antiporter MnhB subunit